jgi:antiviral helicase SKI2
MDTDEFLKSLEQAEEMEQIVPTDEFPYGIMAIGAVKDQLYPTQCPPTNLPLGLGPFGNQDLKSDLKERFLVPGSYVPELFKYNQRFLKRDIDLNSLMLMPTPSKTRMKLRIKRDLLKGTMDFGKYEEIYVEDKVLTAKNSTSLKREPTNAANFVRGKSTNIPFIPGGFSVNSSEVEDQFAGIEATLDLDGPLQTIPPGFDRGLRFEVAEDQQLDVGNILNANDDILLSLLNDSSETPIPEVSHSQDMESSKDVDNFLPETDAVFTVQPPKKEKKQREWAHMVDVNQEFPEFYDLVPEMAYSYPFELDVFQKRAVFHLEKSESVFIAAHTSAGKTVVAEYAIALAQKHMTRAIYTSPIKALSNQKFRDFTNTFDDVGILTGDIQIRPEAACLVMTTEILRSMLYRGADLIRDVEFVIFDEVHYVNDADRGVVWEEVIIMLPEHVTLILLSATVPNTKEFADWVGRTKQKDIYVISTLKRPVPLEHHLYVGKDLFKIVDANKNFLQSGYKQAYEILNPPKKPVTKADSGRGRQKASRGAPTVVQQKGNRSFNSSTTTDKNMFVNLIGHLKKQNLVPAIVFAFSKKKCEEYAQALTNIDLTAGQSEKSKIHSFIEKSLSCLIGTDRELPQVLRMRELLSRGIAVHHSGLLPILKEIVEILFTMGLVKVLFATETFAMGLNCPARTVVFAMTRKHDGQNFRNLLPGEYTQMSGRAGRRGLDSTGMVIIACGDKIPDEHELRSMILGKPTKLESQFRVTYNMILNLLRVEAIKVEDMIKRSFSENATQKALPDQEELRQQGTKLLSKLEKLNCTFCNQDMEPFYEHSARILTLSYAMNEKIIRSPVGLKALSAGRVVIVNNQMYRNCIGIILGPGKIHSQMAQTASRHLSSQGSMALHAMQSDDKNFWVLVLTDSSNQYAGIFGSLRFVRTSCHFHGYPFASKCESRCRVFALYCICHNHIQANND